MGPIGRFGEEGGCLVINVVCPLRDVWYAVAPSVSASVELLHCRFLMYILFMIPEYSKVPNTVGSTSGNAMGCPLHPSAVPAV